MLTTDLTIDTMLEQPVRDGWWQVDWPDGRHTSFRARGDALQLAACIQARYHCTVVIRHRHHLTHR